MSPIRKPRQWLTKHNHRYKPFRTGTRLFYDTGKRVFEYTLSSYDDCYYSCRQKYADYQTKNQYNIYLWLKPRKPRKTGVIFPHRGIMRYNRSLWNMGYIGHAVDVDEVFATKGEWLFSCMARYIRYESIKIAGRTVTKSEK